MKKSFIAIIIVLIAVGVYLFSTTKTTNQEPQETVRATMVRATQDRIVFNSNRDGGRMDVWLMDKDGGNLVQLTKNQGNNYGPQWNQSDKSTIVFVSDRDGGNNELYSMNADGSNQKRLTNSPEEEIWPAFSKDGRYAVFGRGPRGGKHDIWKFDIQTKQEMNISNTPDADELEAFFNPQTTKIVYTSDRAKTGVYNCFVADTDGKNTVQLTFSETTQDHCMYNTKGDKVSFARENPEDKNDWQMWATDVGQESVSLAAAAFEAGRLFAQGISAGSGKNPRETFLVSQDNVLNDCAEWSHDDNALVFEGSTDFEKNGDVYLYDLQTKQLINLTPDTEDWVDLHPVW